MQPKELGKKYNRIARWWHEQHHTSRYGLEACEKLLRFAPEGGKALDVGCGAGGRFIHLLESRNFRVTGVDVSEEMTAIAKANHPEHTFTTADICTWEAPEHYDLILAWDSTFHLPLSQQRPVLDKLCSWLAPGGALMYTFGDAEGEHTDTWHDDTFYYSSIGINANLAALLENNLTCRHLELDQWPMKHVVVITTKEH